MIAPDAKPIGNRNPYKPIDVSGRKPAPPPAPSSYAAWLEWFQRHLPSLVVTETGKAD